jgi:hypothetical protein
VKKEQGQANTKCKLIQPVLYFSLFTYNHSTKLVTDQLYSHTYFSARYILKEEKPILELRAVAIFFFFEFPVLLVETDDGYA